MSKEQWLKRSFSLFVGILCSLNLLISQSDPHLLLTHHNFQSLTARTSFQNFLIDHSGLMYIVTSEGILLYNGITEQFINRSESATSHDVTSMAEDADGIIWLGCEDGSIFRIINKEVFPWSPQEGLPKHEIYKIVIDDKNRIWIATKGECVYFYDKKYLYHFGKEDGILHEDINDLIWIKNKGIFISTDLGIQHLDYNNDKKIIDQIRLNCINEKDIVQKMTVFQDKIYLNNLSAGIIEWKPGENSCQTIWNNKDRDLTIDLSINSDFEVILNDHNIHILSRHHKIIHNIREFFDASDIRRMFLDEMNTLWILHKSQGLISVFLPIALFPLPAKTVQDISMNKDRTKLLICTDSELLIMNAATGKIINTFFKGENLTSIFPANATDIFWIGSYGQGLIKFNLDNGQWKRFKKEQGLPDNSILQITGNKQFIWLTSLGGIMRMDNSNSEILSHTKTFNQKDGLPTTFIYQIATDHNNRIWIGTDGNGIHYLDSGSSHVESLDNVIKTHSVYNIEYSNNQILYFNSSKLGLGFYEIMNDSIYWIDSPVKNLEYDGIVLLSDTILLTTGSGFLTMHSTNSKMSIMMDEEFGLTEIQPSLNSIFKDPDGNVWIGGKNNLLQVQASAGCILSKPKNSFSRIKVFENYINQYADTVLAYNENQISFEFNAIQYLASDHISYRYQLEGYDTKWIYSREGKESYSSLSPGIYKFRLQSSIDRNFNTNNEINFSFEINKPFWLCWWFIVLVLFLIFLIIRYIVKRREMTKIKEEAVRRKTSELEFEILRSQVNPHFLFNSFNSVISLIEDDKEKAITFTENLSDYFRDILKYRDTPLITLEEELIVLKNYLELLELRFPEQIFIEYGTITKRNYIAPMTLQLLMENAIKHNEINITHPLRIQLHCRNQVLVFSNNINQRKSKVDSMGFGLGSIRFRYQLLTNRQIIIENKEGYFSVEIPLLQREI